MRLPILPPDQVENFRYTGNLTNNSWRGWQPSPGRPAQDPFARPPFEPDPKIDVFDRHSR